MIKITVQRHRIKARLLSGDNMIEEQKTPLETYVREKTDIGIKDKSEAKRLFIEKIAQEVKSTNEAEERKFKKKRSGTFLRLTIIKIT